MDIQTSMSEWVNTYTELWITNPWGRAAGILATVLFILAMLLRGENSVKKGLGLANIFAAFNLWTIHAHIASAISIIAAVRLGMSGSALIGQHSKMVISGFFVLLYTAILALTYRTPVDLLAYFGTVVNTLSTFNMSGLRFRAGLCAGSSFWLCYDVMAGAYEIALATLLGLLAALFAMKRELQSQRTSKQST